MNEERKEQIETIIKMVIVVICASLYAWGGIENRQLLRRILAPCLAGASISWFSRSWCGLIHAPAFGIASSLGYGADSLLAKIFKRAYCGLAFGLAGSVLAIKKQNWLILGFQISLCMAVMIAFGVFNPFGSARIEESVIGLFIYAIPIMSARK